MAVLAGDIEAVALEVLETERQATLAELIKVAAHAGHLIAKLRAHQLSIGEAGRHRRDHDDSSGAHRYFVEAERLAAIPCLIRNRRFPISTPQGVNGSSALRACEDSMSTSIDNQVASLDLELTKFRSHCTSISNRRRLFETEELRVLEDAHNKVHAAVLHKVAGLARRFYSFGDLPVVTR